MEYIEQKNHLRKSPLVKHFFLSEIIVLRVLPVVTETCIIITCLAVPSPVDVHCLRES